MFRCRPKPLKSLALSRRFRSSSETLGPDMTATGDSMSVPDLTLAEDSPHPYAGQVFGAFWPAIPAWLR